MSIVEDSCVSHAPFFSALSERDQRRIFERMRLEVHHSGETLFRKGEPSTALYLVKSGWIRLLADGGIPIASEGPASLVGETDVFLARSRTIGAAVAQESEMWVLTAQDLAELIAESPQMGFDLSGVFGSRLAQLDRFLVEQRLKQVPALAGLSDNLLTAIAHHLAPVARKAGETIFERGEVPRGLFLIESGRVQIEKPGAEGSPTELAAGETLGAMALLTGAPYRHSAHAATDVALWSLPAIEFEALSTEFPMLRRAISTSVQESLAAQDREQAATRLAKMPLFAGQPREVLLAVAERMVARYVPVGDMVFSDGDPGDSLYVVDSGEVEIATSARAGSEILARMGPDQFFGEMALLTGKARTTAARAVNGVSLWALGRSDFEELALRYPSISLALSKVLSERLAEMDRRYSQSQLRRMKLFAGMSPSQLDDIGSRLRQVHFRRGQLLLREGDPGEELILLESGRVQLLQGTGRDACALADLGAGEVVGELALLTGNPQADTVIALSDVGGWALRKADFDQLVAANPTFALALSRVLSERLHSPTTRRPRATVAPAPAPASRVAAPVALAPSPSARPEPAREEWAVEIKKETRVARHEPKAGLLAGAKAWLAGIATWFGSLSLGARLRLVLIALLIIWLIGIAVPSLLLRTLAADDVTSLRGAIAFVQRDTSAVAMAMESEAPQGTVLQAGGLDTRAQVAPVEPFAVEEPQPVEPTVEPTQAPPTAVPATATPWIIVVTSTPLPATDTPIPTATPLPTATPKPKAAVAPAVAKPAAPTKRAQPARDLDSRLGLLNVSIAEPGGLNPGQSYFRLVRVQWFNEQESGGDHTIYIEVLDESGARIVGQGVQIDWAGGNQIVYTENKPATEFPANFPMYATLGSYSVSLAGQPSDRLQGVGMGTPDAPNFKVHTNFKLTYQRTTW